jgi:hypothetical protein
MTAREAKEFCEARDSQLTADQFEHYKRVMVHHDDGSFFNLHYAFAEKHDKWWFVFSEHNGAHFFHEDEVHVHQYDMDLG